MLAALGGVQMAVQHRHVPATAAKCLDRLRREADFRHEDERLLALADDLLDRFEVELGLAAAGDAVQEKWLKAADFRCRLQFFPGRQLIGGERGRGRGGNSRCRPGRSLRNGGRLIDAPGESASISLFHHRLDRHAAARRRLLHLAKLDRPGCACK